jgi:hypothetical protein
MNDAHKQMPPNCTNVNHETLILDKDFALEASFDRMVSSTTPGLT